MNCLLKTKKELKEIKETGDITYIYRNELDKPFFQHDMVYGDFKDLTKRTASDKVLRGKAFNITKNLKYDGYQKGLASMVYKFFDKKYALGSGVTTLANNQRYLDVAAQQLPKELHKPIIKKSKKSLFWI